MTLTRKHFVRAVDIFAKHAMTPDHPVVESFKEWFREENHRFNTYTFDQKLYRRIEQLHPTTPAPEAPEGKTGD